MPANPRHAMIHAAEVPEARDAPVQYFQSIIAVLLAVSGALLFQVRFFDNNRTERSTQHKGCRHIPVCRSLAGIECRTWCSARRRSAAVV